MATEYNTLDDIVRQVLAAVSAVKDQAGAEPEAAVTMRERFCELLVLSLANLYGKTPVETSLFDRSMLRAAAAGLDDNESGKLSNRAEDWIRLEGLVRVLEGQKSYTLNRPCIAVLSIQTAEGTLGEVMERVAACYAQNPPSPELRRRTRQLASYFMTRLGRR
jgi:hypothetical protein